MNQLLQEKTHSNSFGLTPPIKIGLSNFIKISFCLAVISLLLAVNSMLFAQTPDWIWAKSAGTSADEYPYDIARDVDGNIYACGFFFGPSMSFGNITLTNSGNWNFFVVKYDSNGNVLWAKNPDGTPEAAAGSIAIDGANNVYVTGSFWGPTLTIGDTTLTNVNYSAYEDQSDIFIIKYDPSGNVLWAKSMGGSKSEVGWSIAVDPFDNIILSGWFTSPDAAFDSLILVSLEDDPNLLGDTYIAKLNSNGKVLWVKGAGTTGYYDIVESVTSDNSGNIYAIGTYSGPSITWDTLTLDNTALGFSDIFITRLDSAGNIIWLKNIEGDADDNGRGIASDSHGNIFITGSFASSTLNFGNTSLINSHPGTGDWFIAKYDSTGNQVSAHSAEGNGNEFDWRAVTCDAEGNVYATAEYSSDVLTFDSISSIGNAGYLDIFIVKYNSSGDLVWVTSIGSDSNDEPLGIAVSAVDNVYVAGGFDNDLIFDNTTLINKGGLDFFIAKLANSNVGINEIANEKAITVYPNPSSDKITVSFSSNEKGELQILNLSGQLIFYKEINSMREEIDVSKLPAGVYLITATNATRKLENVFLKQ